MPTLQDSKTPRDESLGALHLRGIFLNQKSGPIHVVLNINNDNGDVVLLTLFNVNGYVLVGVLLGIAIESRSQLNLAVLFTLAVCRINVQDHGVLTINLRVFLIQIGNLESDRIAIIILTSSEGDFTRTSIIGLDHSVCTTVHGDVNSALAVSSKI